MIDPFERALAAVVDENETLRSDLTSANERAVAAADESLRLAGLLEVERERVGLMEAERAVVKAALEWFRFESTNEHDSRIETEDELRDAVDDMRAALLALRAGGKTNG